MSYVLNLPISKKYFGAFGAICLLCVLLGSYTLFGFRQIASKCIDLRDNALPSVVVLSAPRLKADATKPDRARQSLDSTIEASKKVEQQINLIATAATEQASAAGEFSESTSQISQLASENAQESEEAVEILKELAGLAGDLESLIHQFRLEDGQQEKKTAGRTQTASARSASLRPLRTARA